MSVGSGKTGFADIPFVGAVWAEEFSGCGLETVFFALRALRSRTSPADVAGK